MPASSTTSRSRRSLLKTGLAALTVPSLTPVSLLAGQGHRSLVCIYLVGGTDGNEVAVRMDQYAAYAGIYKSSAYLQRDLLPASGLKSGIALGFSPAAAGVHDLFETRLAALVGNSGSVAGRFDSSLRYFPGGFFSLDWATKATGATAANGLLHTGFRGLNGTVANTTLVSGNAWNLEKTGKVVTRFPDTPIGAQLRVVAQAFASGLQSGVFVIPAAGFSTNSADNYRAVLSQLSAAIRAFYEATVELGRADSVTTFTLSDFYRNLAGKDLAAQATEIVVGGAVLGGDAYSWNGSSLISRDQYLAALASWYGLSFAEIGSYFSDAASVPAVQFLA